MSVIVKGRLIEKNGNLLKNRPGQIKPQRCGLVLSNSVAKLLSGYLTLNTVGDALRTRLTLYRRCFLDPMPSHAYR